MTAKKKAEELGELFELIRDVVGEEPMVRPKRERFAPKKGFCEYCGRYKTLTKDHFFPRSYLRTMAQTDPHKWEIINTDVNIVMACFTCQKAKDDLHPERWLEAMPKSWVVGKQFVRDKLRELENLPLERLIAQPKHPTPRLATPKETTVARRTTIGPTRDWTDLMNLMIIEMVKKSQEVASTEGFTHVYKGSLKSALEGVSHLGTAPGSIGDRLSQIGYLKINGKEQKWQGKTIWLIRNELVSKEDATRADYLYREAERNAKATRRSKPKKGSAEPVSHPKSVARFEVKEDELHPGKQVVKRPDGPGEYARMNREILHLEEENRRLKAQVEDWKDEAEKLQAKLDAINVGELETQVTRYQTMVSHLLSDNDAAKMLREAAQIGRGKG